LQLHPVNKTHLKDLHSEIDFLDRKIAHCQTFEKFESEDERTAAIAKLQKKRGGLAKIAVEFAGKGIEYNAKDLPRSFRNAAVPA
jgi:hypothetical protein